MIAMDYLRTSLYESTKVLSYESTFEGTVILSTKVRTVSNLAFFEGTVLYLRRYSIYEGTRVQYLT